jgi:heptosyltransferase II
MKSGGRHAGRVLVVLPNWLGDLVMASPLLDLLHAARDDAQRPLAVVASVRRRWAPLLSRDPRLDSVITYERTGTHAGLRGVCRLAAAWRQTQADAAVICPPSLRMALTAWLARIPSRVGERHGGRGLWLTLPLAPVQPRGRWHHADELRRLGLVLLETMGLAVPSEPGDRIRLPGLDSLPPAVLGNGPALWVLAPGATYGPAKTWPSPRVAEFLRLAIRDAGVRVAIVGDQGASGILATLREQTPDLPWRRETPGPAGVIDLVGATTLIDLVALLKAATAFLGNDSGVMHLSAALDVPTLGLFGSSSRAWTGPRGQRAMALTATGFPCQPCFRKTCNQDVFCLETLSGEDVFTALQDLVAGATGRGGQA